MNPSESPRRRMLALMKYDDMAASTRQRLLQYRPALTEAGIDVDVQPLLPNTYLKRLAEPGIGKKLAMGGAYARRLRTVLRPGPVDLIWLHCELLPYLPAWFEQFVFWSGAPVILDFDDAIFHMYDAHPAALVRWALGRKLQMLMRRAAACSCGNAYLQAYALRFNPRSIILPTVVDTDLYRPAERAAPDVPVIGWIGSPSTAAYLAPAIPLLERLVRAGRAKVRLVGSGGDPARLPLFEHVAWSEAGEIAAVQGFDIGIMPVPDTPFARGKCGYKLIQYMACGVPTVSSPVGVNREIVTDGVDGFLVGNDQAWAKAFDRLLDAPSLRARFGAAGRIKVVDRYSLASQTPRLIAMIDEASGRPVAGMSGERA